MADVNECPEPTFPTKRIPDVITNDFIGAPKKQKVEDPESNSNTTVKETLETPEPLTETQKEKGKQKLVQEEETEQQQEEEIERLNGKEEIDRKGKGILIEEDDDDDEEDDDDDDDDSDSDSDSDSPTVDAMSEDGEFVDDPLAEVNLDNILPSRTRRRTIDPGSHLGNDLPGEDSDESDDPDA